MLRIVLQMRAAPAAASSCGQSAISGAQMDADAAADQLKQELQASPAQLQVQSEWGRDGRGVAI